MLNFLHKGATQTMSALGFLKKDADKTTPTTSLRRSLRSHTRHQQENETPVAEEQVAGELVGHVVQEAPPVAATANGQVSVCVDDFSNINDCLELQRIASEQQVVISKLREQLRSSEAHAQTLLSDKEILEKRISRLERQLESFKKSHIATPATSSEVSTPHVRLKKRGAASLDATPASQTDYDNTPGGPIAKKARLSSLLKSTSRIVHARGLLRRKSSSKKDTPCKVHYMNTTELYDYTPPEGFGRMTPVHVPTWTVIDDASLLAENPDAPTEVRSVRLFFLKRSFCNYLLLLRIPATVFINTFMQSQRSMSRGGSDGIDSVQGSYINTNY
eukprot:Colp12_sorted_trinity150504_noHs@29835